MIIKAQHKAFWVAFMKIFTKFQLERFFRKVTIAGSFNTEIHRSVLLIGNHFSWWDGFVAYYLNEKCFRKKFHVMMLEEQLKSRLFLSKAGAYSVNRKSRSQLESMNYTQALLDEPGNLVLMYPQGRFYSLHDAFIIFEKGIQFFLPLDSHKHSLCFYACFIDYFENKKPSMTIYIKEENFQSLLTKEHIQEAYNHFYQECIVKQNKTTS